jgi:hypothetical protein
MKYLISICLLFVFITSCKKEIKTIDSSAYLRNVRTGLKDSLAANDYAQLDFSKAILNKVDSVQLYFLRIPFNGKSLANDFLVVKTNSNGVIEKGRIIHLEGKANEFGEGKIRRRRFNGNIAISSLNRQHVLNSSIENGYITAFHQQANLREQTDPVLMAGDLPEVVVVAYVHNIEPISYSDWYLLTSLFDSGGGSNGGNYYGSLDGDGYGGGGGGGYGYYGGGTGDTGGGTEIPIDQTIFVDVDTYINKDPIDVEQFLKCFDNIADAGAQCEISVFADIPVDSDPNKLFDFRTGSPGHTFIQIKKTSADGSQAVMQNLGFYPKTGWKTIGNFATDAKFVDDGQHEFNASFNKTLTPDQLKSVIAEIRGKENAQYDLDDFNCTDWALDIFNNQGSTLTIPKYLVPGSIKADGVNTPQGLYNKLKEMKDANVPGSDKISIGFMKGWVSNSNGPCN